MDSMTATISSEWTQTRVLLASPTRDVLKAVLPPLSDAHPQAAITLLEGLALWHQRRLSVVLSVGEQESSCFAQSLCDALGHGASQLHFDVAIVPHRRPATRRISGVGDFRDLRQLCLWGQP